jgi:hypothetical protein
MPEYQQLVAWPSEQGEFFDRGQTYGATPGQNGWVITDVSSSGTPTYVNSDGGGFVATLAATSEAEQVTLSQGDKLIFDIDEIQVVSFYALVSGVDAVTTILMGVASAHNTTPDSVAAHAWFRMEGSASTSNVVVETDDGATDNDDKATGQTLAAVLKKFTIDFSNGKSDVRFFIDDQRVAASTTFSMAGYSGKLQPYFSVQKASGTGIPALTVRAILPVKCSKLLV